MIKNYLITAWRNISRNKLYTAINISGLALGICACLVIYLITRFELSFENFQPEKDRIYRIVTSVTNPDGKRSDMAANIIALPIAMRSELSGFENVTAFYDITLKVTVPNGNNEPRAFDAAQEISPIIVAEPQYFRIFKYHWLAGNAETALNEPFKVVLSKNEAIRYFGNAAPDDLIGREVIYQDSLKVTVAGIVEDYAKNSDFGFKDFISFASTRNKFFSGLVDLHNWSFWDYDAQGYVKLAKDVTPEQIEKQFPDFVRSHIEMPPGMKASLSLQPLSDVHFNAAYGDSYSRKASLPTLYGLLAIAGFILIIASINFINLSTAQSLRRAKEVGVRKTLGGSKTSLTIQFLTETFLMTTVSAIIAVLITNPVITAYRSVIPDGVELSLFTPLNILFLLLITIVTALLAGFYPARVLSSYLPALSLKGQGSPNLNRKSYLRKALIVFQFTVSLIFIIGTVVVADQVHFILNTDMGFNKDAIITTNTGSGYSRQLGDVFVNKIRQLKDVKMVSRHRIPPAAFGHPVTFMSYKGTNGEVKFDASFETCDQNYVPLFGLHLIAGRNLLPSDTLREFLINETCAKALGFKKPQDAIGKIVEVGIDGAREPIVGVVKDFHSESFHEAITPFFLCSLKKNEQAVSIKLATAGKQADSFKSVLASLQKISKEVYPTEKFEYRFFDKMIAMLYEKEQKTARLMNTAMAIAIIISCMGLFGLATFTAQQRVKEIGIRKVLGAKPIKIVQMLSGDFLALVGIAFLIASPIAWYLMHQWLQDYAYRVSISWWIFALSGAAAITIALITISFQSIKAALANPVHSLRSE
ncbi:MAG TPA: ABC transporter permease [Mucilaginibacter sp.]|nr:ABC transporter permease [Mucilaginibacter sp.]